MIFFSMEKKCIRTTAEGWLKGKFKFKENLLSVYHNNRFKQVETPTLICNGRLDNMSPNIVQYCPLSVICTWN